MAYQVGRLLVPDWRNVEVGAGLFTYTFIFRISSQDRLPPGAYCDLISRYARLISKVHSLASIWVQVDSPALWYPFEIRRGLDRSPMPCAVTRGGSRLTLADFNFRPGVSQHGLPAPPFAPDPQSPVGEDELACLRVLARVTQGLTSEVASLSGLGLRRARDALDSLRRRNLVDHAFPRSAAANSARSRGPGAPAVPSPATGKNLPLHRGGSGVPPYSDVYPYWGLKKRGLTIALRSWGVPAGFQFTARLAADHGEARRHRVTARLWPAWLKKDLGLNGEIWAGWTEVNLADIRSSPDALAWGRVDERETLFWLEVESGHRSTEKTLEKITKSFRASSWYARERELNLVFAVLAIPWVQKVLRTAFMNIEPHVAVIVGDWRTFGELPVIQWGRVTTPDRGLDQKKEKDTAIGRCRAHT